MLVLRVPVDEFAAVMTALEDLGTMRFSDSTSKDVTTEVIDVEERVQTLQNSLDRLQRFQRAATNIDDLIAFEDQITEREQEQARSRRSRPTWPTRPRWRRSA